MRPRRVESTSRTYGEASRQDRSRPMSSSHSHKREAMVGSAATVTATVGVPARGSFTSSESSKSVPNEA